MFIIYNLKQSNFVILTYIKDKPFKVEADAFCSFIDLLVTIHTRINLDKVYTNNLLQFVRAQTIRHKLK